MRARLSLIVPGGDTSPTFMNVGVVFSGGAAPGLHNIVEGLMRFISTQADHCRLVGFVGGNKGLLRGKAVPVTPESLALFRNQAGGDIIGVSEK